jgi:soluble lytic murein transglycosylase-like protein
MKGFEGPSLLGKLLLALGVMVITALIIFTSWGSINPLNPGGPSGPATRFDSIIREASIKYGVEEVLIKAVMKQESDFDPAAKSGAGAQGLMQLTPPLVSDLGDEKTALGKQCRLRVTDPFDPEQNIKGGTCYLSYLLKRYDDRKEMALAAYKDGPGNVDKYNGIPPFDETQNYVRMVMRYYNDYKDQSPWTVAA